MIDVKIRYGVSGPFTLIAQGHANQPRNEDGRDLVCCAASTIVTTLAISCAQIKGAVVNYHQESGYAALTVSNTETLWEELMPRFRMTEDGLQGLMDQYPQALRLTVEN